MSVDERTVRVLVAHPSSHVREGLAALIARESGTAIVGTAATGRETVERARTLRPSVIVLAACVGQPDAARTTREIMVHGPRPVVVVSDESPANLRRAAEALAEGAVSLQRLPPLGEAAVADAQRFVRVVAALADVSLVRRRSGRSDATTAVAGPRHPSGVVAVAGSTGAPVALQQLLADLPGDLPVPILVVQHLPPGYVETFAAWLDAATPLRVSVARERHLPGPGEVLLAEDGRHLRLDAYGRLEPSDGPPVDGFRPAASILFASVAEVHGAASLAVVLSGMGTDGVAGLRRLRELGGYVVAQDEESSAVFGMPGATVAAGLAHRVTPAAELATVVRSAVRTRGRR